MIKKLQYRFSRTKIDAGAIEDVYDGELYKKHFCPGGFLSNQHNISFLGNTDGVALIRSNGYGVWPVYLVVNEIPPSERCVYMYMYLVFIFVNLLKVFVSKLKFVSPG